jgi:hypothetical protein
MKINHFDINGSIEKCQTDMTDRGQDKLCDQ